MILRPHRRFIVICLTVIIVLGIAINTVKAETDTAQVVVLKSQDAEPYNEGLLGFKKCLNEQGLKADFHILSLNGDPTKASDVMKKARERKPNLILALGSLATKTVSGKITDVPIVSGMVLRSNAIKEAVNIKAVFLDYPIETQLSWLKRFLPEAKTIGVIYNLEENQELIDKAQVIAGQMKLNLFTQRVGTPKEIPQALENLSRKADVLWGIPDKMVFTTQTAKQILLFSFRQRIPFVGLSSSWVKAGALYSLDWDYQEVGRECGTLAFSILNNKKIAEIQPEAKNSVKYALNLKTAERMKIDLPEKLVKQAKNVY